ncbi:MAG: response regulator [Pseudomonadota bacterium]
MSEPKPRALSRAPLVAALVVVALAGMAAHPALINLLLGTGAVSPLLAAAPGVVAGLAYVTLVRWAIRRSEAALELCTAERDGARDREKRQRAELQMAETALDKAEMNLAAAQTEAATKSAYLSTISHEVRTPLNGVIGMADLLADTDLDDEQTALVGTVRQSADALQAVLSGVLDFAALEAGELDLEDAPFDIREAAETAIAAETNAAHKKGVELVFDAAPDMATQGRGDGERIRQMVSILVGNAVKFTERGQVVVRLSSRDRAGAAEITVEVSDTGIGIDEKDQARVFLPFERGDPAATERYGGTGLGLSIASKLAAMMGGNIHLSSKKGEGSTFLLRFMTRLRTTGRAADAEAKPLEGLRYLVLDDSQEAADALRRQLAQRGAQVVMANEVEEAEDVLWESASKGPKIDAIFLDLHIEGGDGAALAAVLAERLPHMPLILTTDQDPRAAEAALREGYGMAVLEKPLLGRALDKALAAARKAAKQPKKPRKETNSTSKTIAGIESAPSAAVGAKPQSGSAVPILQPACIILADDNATNRTLIEKFLANEPMTLIHAPDGVGAVEAWADWAPDLILMDVSMPRMNGLEATMRIREMERAQGLANVPIIALTARAMADDREKCLEAGMNDYVAKPIRKAELKSKITEWTRARRMIA